jgi:WXG100 family type VII secretion target
MTWAEFKADLAQLQAAIGSVRSDSDHINDLMGQISGQFSAVGTAWISPTEQSFDDVQKWFMNVSKDLHGLLDEMVSRLGQAYANYHAAEEANYYNVT